MTLIFRRCSRFPGEYPEQFFRRHRSPLNAFRGNEPLHYVCIGCELTERTEKKRANRWIVKANSTLRRHAKRFEISISDMITRYGWNVDRIAHELEHHYNNGCSNCGRSYRSMGHGLADVTIDIFDRTALPVYGHNTRIICQTCNREKGTLSVEDNAAKSIGWRLWEETQKQLEKRNTFGLALFDHAYS